MAEEKTSSNLEIEIKVRLEDRAAFAARLPGLGFQMKTPETHERNLLFDTPDEQLRRRGELLRIREYGGHFKLTHKAPAPGLAPKVHKTRVETECDIGDGDTLASIFRKLGFQTAFIYEKFRSEWTDGAGHIVIDRTPIGDFAELEGAPAWIDAIAAKLEISRKQYITASYAKLFEEWKAATKHPARNMTFEETAVRG